MYAIVATGGKQYKAEKDQVIKVEKIKAEVGETVDLQALMLVDGDNVIVGEAASAVSVKAGYGLKRQRRYEILILEKS